MPKNKNDASTTPEQQQRQLQQQQQQQQLQQQPAQEAPIGCFYYLFPYFHPQKPKRHRHLFPKKPNPDSRPTWPDSNTVPRQQAGGWRSKCVERRHAFPIRCLYQRQRHFPQEPNPQSNPTWPDSNALSNERAEGSHPESRPPWPGSSACERCHAFPKLRAGDRNSSRGTTLNASPLTNRAA